jgi:hypothetical protein
MTTRMGAIRKQPILEFTNHVPSKRTKVTFCADEQLARGMEHVNTGHMWGSVLDATDMDRRWGSGRHGMKKKTEESQLSANATHRIYMHGPRGCAGGRESRDISRQVDNMRGVEGRSAKGPARAYRHPTKCTRDNMERKNVRIEVA